MKTGTEAKLKFKALKRKLSLPLWQANGLLETLWRVTEANTPAGDIGRLSNEEIAAALEWEGDANELVSALVEFRWLDNDAVYRLVVHNWSVHCPNHLKGGFARIHRPFADQEAKLRTQASAKHTSQATQPSTPAKLPAKDPATKPNLTKPNQTSSSPTPQIAPSQADSGFWEEVEEEISVCGVTNAKTAIECARERGFTIELIKAIVKHYRTNQNRTGFEAGALYFRIVNGSRTTPADQGWPEPLKLASAATPRSPKLNRGQLLGRRVNDLMEAGKSRDEAIAIAESEFPEAAP